MILLSSIWTFFNTSFYLSQNDLALEEGDLG